MILYFTLDRIFIICLRINAIRVILQGVEALLSGVEVWGGTTLLSALNELEKIQNCSYVDKFGIQPSTTDHLMLLE
mgnify:CR=1 FL=1